MRRIARAFCFIALCAYPAVVQADGKTISGDATVIDADQIEINGTRIILYGVDAMDRDQICAIDGKPWDCWGVAARELQTLVANSAVTCTDKELPDPFQRIYAVCEAGEVDLGEALVRAGLALAFHIQADDYVAAQAAAKADGLGLWRAKFVEPWKARAARGAPLAR